jgi:hypothetical protein
LDSVGPSHMPAPEAGAASDVDDRARPEGGFHQAFQPAVPGGTAGRRKAEPYGWESAVGASEKLLGHGARVPASPFGSAFRSERPPPSAKGVRYPAARERIKSISAKTNKPIDTKPLRVKNAMSTRLRSWGFTRLCS